jgi:hypothetical protein
MKQIFVFIYILAICFDVHSQTGVVRKTKTTTTTTIQKPVTVQQSEKNVPVPKLPDLRITSINVKMYNSQLADSTKRFLEISYTIKNDGPVSVALNTVLLDGIIKTDGTQAWNQPASYGGCGAFATTLSGVILNPGAEYSGSYRCYTKTAIALCKFYTLSVDSENAILEIAENNNGATTSILIQ